MIEKLQRKYALSEQGAKDLVKGCLACALQNLSFMFPVGLLYNLVGDLMGGGVSGSGLHGYSTTPPISPLILKAACVALRWRKNCGKFPWHFSGKRILLT